MKGNKRILTLLNARLASELGAFQSYAVAGAVLEVQGYRGLSGALSYQARGNMGRAEALVERVTFLEGEPVRKAQDVSAPGTVKAILAQALKLALEAVDGYNETITACLEVSDHGTRQLCERHLADSEAHVRYLEQQLGQVEVVGIESYLASAGAPANCATSPVG